MMIRTQILLPEQLLQDLRTEAARKKTSVSDVVRTIIVEKVGKKISKKMTGVEFLQYLADHAYKGELPKNFSTDDNLLYKLP